jgi:hypothetical protein
MNCDWLIKPKNKKRAYGKNKIKNKILHLRLKISVNSLPKKENKILKAKLYWIVKKKGLLPKWEREKKTEKKSALPAPETDRAANDGNSASVFASSPPSTRSVSRSLPHSRVAICCSRIS